MDADERFSSQPHSVGETNSSPSVVSNGLGGNRHKGLFPRSGREHVSGFLGKGLSVKAMQSFVLYIAVLGTEWKIREVKGGGVISVRFPTFPTSGSQDEGYLKPDGGLRG